MAETNDRDSKTEEATEKKIRDAVEKGNVPFSKEAATAASLAAVFIAASTLVAPGVLRLRANLSRFLEDPGGWRLENAADALGVLGVAALPAAYIVVPVVAVIAVAGIAASLLQNAPQLVSERIRPQLSRLSLSNGWKRIFGLHGQVEFLKALLKLAAVSVLGFFVLKAAFADMVSAIFVEPSAIPHLVFGVVVKLLAAVAVATLVLLAADLVWARLFWRRELRMTRQEVKDELKLTEGDPLVKARLRSLARDRARRRMIANVPKATLVIVNPTHYAVALRYVREEGGAPLVVAKGLDLIALKIRAVAEQHAIPVVEDKLLARSLYENINVDQMIPPQFYKAVAEIVFFLMSRGRYGRGTGRGQLDAEAGRRNNRRT
jgi:flagellar biosynthetic protein FlhB